MYVVEDCDRCWQRLRCSRETRSSLPHVRQRLPPRLGLHSIVLHSYIHTYIYVHTYIHTGTATHWPEYLLYNLETDEEEKMQDVKNAAVPYNNVGLLEVHTYIHTVHSYIHTSVHTCM